jgi:hypothetical protein
MYVCALLANTSLLLIVTVPDVGITLSFLQEGTRHIIKNNMKIDFLIPAAKIIDFEPLCHCAP